MDPLGEAGLTGPTQDTRVWVDDVNSDGKLDLLVGDRVTLIAPAKGLSKEEFKKKFAAWRSRPGGVPGDPLGRGNSVAARARAQNKASGDFNRVYDWRTLFMKEELLGLVWLYLQK